MVTTSKWEFGQHVGANQFIHVLKANLFLIKGKNVHNDKDTGSLRYIK